VLTLTSNGISNTFSVYAANNYDATSTCSNFPSTSDIQNNNCTLTSVCVNIDFGRSTQNNNCADPSFCNNVDVGGSSIQNVACANGFPCTNVDAGGSSIQNAACQSSSCLNAGTSTNVISNSASLCTSGTPDTTTLCQQGRTFVFHNH